MTVYRKTGGVWRAAQNANVFIKWGGAWQRATYVYRKTNGGWADTGYRSIPNPPQSIWVHGWDFNNVALNWTGPAAGGAPAVSYQVAIRDSAGNGVGQPDYDNVNPPWGNFAVGQDGYYIFYVRSKSAAGLYSNWVQGPRVKIGHSEQGYYQTENRTRYWASPTLSGYKNRDDPFWVGIPGNVVITGMHWRNLGTPQSTVVTPTGSRTVNWILEGGDYGPINANFGTVGTGHSADYPFNNQGTGQVWGIVARGSGWSTTGNSYYMYYVDAFWCDGSETYQVSVYYVSRNYEGNSYW
jgi:hypothetical protein